MLDVCALYGLCLSFVLGDCVLVWLLELAVLLYLLSSPYASGRQQQARHTQLLPDSRFWGHNNYAYILSAMTSMLTFFLP